MMTSLPRPELRQWLRIHDYSKSAPSWVKCGLDYAIDRNTGLHTDSLNYPSLIQDLFDYKYFHLKRYIIETKKEIEWY